MSARNDFFFKNPESHLLLSCAVLTYGLLNVGPLNLVGLISEKLVHSIFHVTIYGGSIFLGGTIAAMYLTRKRRLIAAEILLTLGVLFITLPTFLAVNLIPASAPQIPYFCALAGGYIALSAGSVIIAQQILRFFRKVLKVDVFSEADAARAVLDLNRQDHGEPH